MCLAQDLDRRAGTGWTEGWDWYGAKKAGSENLGAGPDFQISFRFTKVIQRFASVQSRLFVFDMFACLNHHFDEAASELFNPVGLMMK